MQTSSNAGQENATIPLITIYLIGLLTWTLFISATNIFNLLNRVNHDGPDYDDEVDHLEESRFSLENQLLELDRIVDEPERLPLQFRSCTDLKNNSDDSKSIRKNGSNFDNEILTDEPLKESNEETKRKMSLHAVLDKGSNNATAPVEKASNLRKVHFTLSMDQYKGQFGSNVLAVSKLVSRDSKYKNSLKNVCDRENGGTTSNKEKCLTNATESPDSSMNCPSTPTFTTSIPQESTLLKVNSNEHFHERATPTEGSVSRKTCKARNDNDSDIFNELEQLLNQTTDDNVEPPQSEQCHRQELFGVVPEKEASSTIVESVTHSCPGAEESRVEEAEEGAEVEKKETVGSPPEGKPLKNCHEAESTILLSRAQSTGYGKEEEDLNAMIRRMIISELKQHRKKKQMVLKRAYSDTESVMSRMKRDSNTRTGLFSFKGRTFFRNVLELEESMRKRMDSGSGTDATMYGIDSKTADLMENATDREETTAIDALASLTRARGSINSLATMCNLHSDILLERKVSVHRLPETPEAIETGIVPTEQNQARANKCTQTEHVYVIHAIKSCPLRKGRPLLQFQLHRLAASPEPASSKTVFANLDYTRFVFRKASDNLIYERSKASSSPSYIPSPERFRWKYVVPSKAK